jgi:hypothetical protein
MIFPLAKTQVFPHIAFCWARMTLWCHAWGSKPPQIASNIHIICIQSILTSYYDVEGHMGAPLTLLRLCRWEWISRKIKLSPSPSDVVMSWLRLQPAQIVSHIHVICIQSVSAPWYVVDGHMGVPLHCYACAGAGVDFRKIELSPSPSDVVMSWLRL